MNDIIKRGVNNYLFDFAFSSSSFASTRAFPFSVSKARFDGTIHHSKAIFLFAPFLRLGSYFGNDSGMSPEIKYEGNFLTEIIYKGL